MLAKTMILSPSIVLRTCQKKRDDCLLRARQRGNERISARPRYHSPKDANSNWIFTKTVEIHAFSPFPEETAKTFDFSILLHRSQWHTQQNMRIHPTAPGGDTTGARDSWDHRATPTRSCENTVSKGWYRVGAEKSFSIHFAK